MEYVGEERKCKKKRRKVGYITYEKIIAAMNNEKKDKTLMSPVVKLGNEMKEPGKEDVKKLWREI